MRLPTLLVLGLTVLWGPPLSRIVQNPPAPPVQFPPLGHGLNDAEKAALQAKVDQLAQKKITIPRTRLTDLTLAGAKKEIYSAVLGELLASGPLPVSAPGTSDVGISTLLKKIPVREVRD